MICPYCTTEIEPIELNGKTFCSNCGLAISSPQVQPHSTKITPLHNPTESAPNSEKSEIASVSCNVDNGPKTIKRVEPTITELLKPTAVVTELAPENGNEPVSEAESEKLAAVDSEVIAKEPETVTTGPVTPVENNEVKTSEDTKPVLMDILDAQPENIRTMSGDELKPLPIEENQGAIKEVETLGASGILLDILSDDAVHKQKEKEMEALEAATELVEKVTPQKKEIEPDQTFKPEGAIKLKLNVLDESPVNPIIHPELEAGPKEIDLPLPEKSLDEPNVVSEVVPEDLPKPETIEDIVNSQQDSQEIEVIDQSFPLEEEMNEKISEVFNNNTDSGDLDLSDLPSMKDKKGKKNKAHVFNEEEIKEILSEEPEDSQPHQETTGQTAGLTATDKSKHLTNYFNHIISNEKKEDSRNSKKKSKKKKKNIAKSHQILYVILFILLLISFGALGYIYYSDEPSPQVNNSQIKNDESYAEDLPSEIPYGYQLKDKVDYNKESQTLTAIYEFTSDETRKLIYNKQWTGEGKAKLTQYTKATSSIFETKEYEGKMYTIFEDGSIIWESKEAFYSIKVKGETYKDLIVKMAASVE